MEEKDNDVFFSDSLDVLQNSDFSPQCRENYQQDKKKIIDGLRRIEGQVRGLQRMVEDNRYSVDVLYQIAASRMALARLATIVLEAHTRDCINKAVQDKQRRENTIEELMEVIRKMIH